MIVGTIMIPLSLTARTNLLSGCRTSRKRCGKDRKKEHRKTAMRPQAGMGWQRNGQLYSTEDNFEQTTTV